MNNNILSFQPKILVSNKKDLGKFLEQYKQAKKNRFGHFAFPHVRKVTPQLISQQIVSVQPMTLPSGLLFYLDYTFGSNASSSLDTTKTQENSSNKEETKDIDFLGNNEFEY